MVLLSSSSLVVVVAAVVVVRRRHDAHVYELRRRREKMRPKNAALNLEPILQRERERKKREKNTRVLCYKGKDWCIYFVSRIDDFCAHHHHAKSRDGGEGGGGPVVVVFVVFCCWTPSRFSEVRSFSCVLVGCN